MVHQAQTAPIGRLCGHHLLGRLVLDKAKRPFVLMAGRLMLDKAESAGTFTANLHLGRFHHGLLMLDQPQTPTCRVSLRGVAHTLSPFNRI